MAARQLAETAPWSLRPSELEVWYNANVRRTRAFEQAYQKAIDQVVQHLYAVCSTDAKLFNVSEIVKGGSFGKGTIVKGSSDVDMVVFINPPRLNPIHSYNTLQEYQQALQGIIARLRTAISQMSSESVGMLRKIVSKEFRIEFEVRVEDEWVPFDLLPTADNFGGGESFTKIFRRMLQIKDDKERNAYSASLIKYQLEFVGHQPGYVKDLIRLVKYWAYDQPQEGIQKSHPLEMITIYHWEKAGSPARFSKAQGLKTVLLTLTNLGSIRHYWTKHYSCEMAEECIRTLGFASPVILDPADPTDNTCKKLRDERRRKMESAARKTLQCTLLRGVVVRPNWQDY